MPDDHDPTLPMPTAPACVEGTPIDRAPGPHTILRTCGAPVSYGGKHDAEHAAHAPAEADLSMLDAVPEEFRRQHDEPAPVVCRDKACSATTREACKYPGTEGREWPGLCVRSDLPSADAAPWEPTAAERARRVVDEAEGRLCECARPDEADNPHRHEADDWCALWRLIDRDNLPAGRAWVEGKNAYARLALARRALIATGYFTSDEVGDDVAPRITELSSHHMEELRELCEAIRLTAEYAQLPAVEGWSWYDALVRFAPDTAARMRAEWEESPAPGQAPTPSEPLDLQDPITRITLRQEPPSWRHYIPHQTREPWVAELTYRGMDAGSWTSASREVAERRARYRLDDLRRQSGIRRESMSIIDFTDEED